VPDSLPDLSTYIDKIIDEGGVTEVSDIAGKVLAVVPPEVLEAHMLRFLRLAVRDRLTERSRASQLQRGRDAVTLRPRRRGQPSTKTARARDQFAADRARWLADTVSTGTRRVALGDATAADLFAAAAYRRAQAAATAAMAVRYEEIAAVLVKHGESAKVSDLTDAELKALFDRP